MHTADLHVGPAPAIADADRQGILDALYRFGAGQDLRRRDLFASAFAADATLDFTQPAVRLGAAAGVMRGRDAIVDTIFAVLAPLATTHTITNPRIRVAGERAVAWALVEAQHVVRDAPARRLLLKNFYETTLSRHADGWRIEALTIENVWLDGEADVLFPRE